MPPPTLSANEIQKVSKNVSITIGQNEVTYIWRSSNRTLGKWLYLSTRYFNIVATVVYLSSEIPDNSGVIAPKYAHISSQQSSRYLERSALKGPRMPQIKWFIAAFLMAYVAPLVTLAAVYRSSFTAILPPRLQDEAVRRCFYGFGQQELWMTGAYLRSAWAAFIMCIAIMTFMKRWRLNPSGRLVSVIRREGASYYLSAAALTLLWAIATLPSVNGMDPYAIFPALRRLLVPIFADRLILKMREISDPQTFATVSALIFDVRDLGDTDDECTHIEGRASGTTEGFEMALREVKYLLVQSPNVVYDEGCTPETSAIYVTCMFYLWRRNLKELPNDRVFHANSRPRQTIGRLSALGNKGAPRWTSPGCLSGEELGSASSRGEGKVGLSILGALASSKPSRYEEERWGVPTACTATPRPVILSPRGSTRIQVTDRLHFDRGIRVGLLGSMNFTPEVSVTVDADTFVPSTDCAAPSRDIGTPTKPARLSH
ncbi:hypothetical protein DFP72DRAFT_851950 [Ephemerocybe angulata]|uniref:DUF6533 domain-containing protein n=1 Tax=Ephemerocybe angulata TaxID=980116 RepID=A0A8H6LZW7_9AGAR|nr:hypothetical protein DFP72DRAFT_851950 [Tulosesus angulatus]